MIDVAGGIAQSRFQRFGLREYELFLRWKKLPEYQLAYDWQSDAYSLTTAARYAAQLGAAVETVEAEPLPLSAHLFDYQRFIVTQALAAKRYAVYADCGLGKTLMFLEWARQVIHRTGGKVLILSPKNIIPQTIDEDRKFYGESLPIVRIDTRRRLAEWLTDKNPDIASGLAITNYEKMIDGQLPELRHLAGLACDESSILKSGGGVIKWNLIKSARGIEYKLSCTATPAPNDIMEYASQAAYLEKLRTEGEILWTFFTRDKHGNWRIKPHAREGFYRFLSSWSIYLRSPAHYGWADNLASIPAPQFFEHKLTLTEEQRGEAQALFARVGAGLFGEQKMGVRERLKLSQLAKGFLYEKAGKIKKARRIASEKPGFVANLIRNEANDGRQVLVWTVFDEESRILSDFLDYEPGIEHATLYGEADEEERAATLERFRRGELQVLISKVSLLGFGMNFQFCSSMVFSGWNDSYEQFYQAIRRAYRYGQTQSLRVHIPYVQELEGMILENVLRKKAGFEADADEQEKYYFMATKDVLRKT